MTKRGKPKKTQGKWSDKIWQLTMGIPQREKDDVPKRRKSSPRQQRRVLRSLYKKHEERKELVGASSWKERKAIAMRAKPTRLEAILKTSLHLAVNNRFVVYQQWLEAGYILDFYIHELRLCFEADGPLHDPEYDARRDRHLAQRNIRTIRFTEADLKTDLETVDRTICREILRRTHEVQGGSAAARP